MQAVAAFSKNLIQEVHGAASPTRLSCKHTAACLLIASTILQISPVAVTSCHALQILSYHILPRSNLLSSNLKDGQTVRTILRGAAPLTVQRSCNSIDFQGPGGKAHVTAADVRTGRDIVVHVVDDVLLPAA